ncbi:hypothetical protein [Aliirhizobium cellulosilyticum]|uniref:Uncharacterized protein n=1 Tax=Aliirhizobium cellulosilyticum TaxID=393664 RepID=A0A7W6Y040_9HYPH|nr:hypothetical protein [Rhizobium cellulosilyticum]MBB4347987.1 hypothetical protein [Rhizobium cellulosilyticum]MBB4409619.1 hypothetical protein [Rhizobium cellulosilyticum]MBB4444307.1 hypothetical protein [Rhizobium cellulosilyticum]
MGMAMVRERSPLRLHIRCENCLRESSKELEIPPGEYVPSDPLELAGEGYLDGVKFHCGHCDSSIGRLFAISGGSRYE